MAKNGGQERAPRILAGAAFLSLCLTVGVATYSPAVRGEASANAKVLAVAPDAQQRFLARVEFDDGEGIRRTAEFPIENATFEPGESLRVRYRREEPTHCRPDPMLRRLAGAVAAALAGVFGAVALVRRRA